MIPITVEQLNALLDSKVEKLERKMKEKDEKIEAMETKIEQLESTWEESRFNSSSAGSIRPLGKVSSRQS